MNLIMLVLSISICLPAFAEEVRTFPGGGAQDLLNVTKNPFEEGNRKRAAGNSRVSVVCTNAQGKSIRAGEPGYEECARLSGSANLPANQTGHKQDLDLSIGNP